MNSMVLKKTRKISLDGFEVGINGEIESNGPRVVEEINSEIFRDEFDSSQKDEMSFSG